MQENEELEEFLLLVISVIMRCDKKSCSLGMVSDNREDKIQFIRDGLNKEPLDDILLSLDRISVDIYKERFSSYDHYCRKSVHDTVSGI